MQCVHDQTRLHGTQNCADWSKTTCGGGRFGSQNRIAAAASGTEMEGVGTPGNASCKVLMPKVVSVILVEGGRVGLRS